MKKVSKIHLFFTSLFFLFILNSSHSQIPPKNDLEDLKLIGMVKSLKQNKYKLSSKSGELIKGSIINDNDSNIHFVFDEFGNKTQEVSRNSKYSNGFEKYSYEYDSRGNKITKKFYTPDGNLNTIYSYKYDDNNNIIEESISFPDGHLGNKYTYKYDKKENLIEYKNHLGNIFNRITIFLYNEKGNLIEESIKDSEGNLISKWTKEYDENGKIIKSVYYYSSGKIDNIKVYKYNTLNKVTEEIITDSDNNLLSEEYNQYDKNGRKIEVKMNIPSYGGMKVKSFYKYDDKGNIIEQIDNTSMGFEKKKIITKYEYDENNNWIKTIYFDRNKPYGMIERTIEYYY